MKQRYLVLDYETKSEADLFDVGAYEYARHSTTEIMWASWACGTRAELKNPTVKSWTPHLALDSLGELLRYLNDDTIIVVAQNAFFEEVITYFVLGVKTVKIGRWLCTASLARALALPGKLEPMAKVLRLTTQKDMVGHKLMLKMSKPKRPRKDEKFLALLEGEPDRVHWHFNLADLQRLGQYCVDDVKTEIAALLKLPMLIPFERKVWELDQKINWRGFAVDRVLVNKALELIERETKNLAVELNHLTRGEVQSPNQRAALLDFVNRRGAFLPNLQAKTLSDWVKLTWAHDPVVRRCIEIRQAASKSSTAKYAAFEARSRTDGRLRDYLIYHLAGPGRWGAAGVQPHNFPRVTIADVNLAIAVIKHHDLEFIRAMYGDVLALLSQTLKGCLVPTKGKKLFGGDQSMIEVRVLFWLADHLAGLKAFIEHRDLYVEMACPIYKKEIEFYDKNSRGERSPEADEGRQVGKRAVLGCGFGMGPDRFGETCEQYGSPVTSDLAELAVATYRKVHWPVPKLWKNYERAAIAAIENPHKSYTINKVKWFMRGRFLMAQLPSGRCNAYCDPAIELERTKWGPRKRISHWGVNPKTRQWAKEYTWGGKLTENTVQGVARDVLANGMVALDDAGYDTVLTVHDSDIAETDHGDATQFRKIMERSPPWAKGLPLKVDTWESAERYLK